jgi:starch phosphorylase
VSAIHARVSRALWRDLWPGVEEHQVPIGYVTNGIHAPSWLAAGMALSYDRCLGSGWQQRIDDPAMWEGIDRLDEVEFWEQHQMLKAELTDYVRRCVAHHAGRRGQSDPTQGGTRPFLDPAILTIGFARRFTAYKRADLLLQDLDRLDRLLNNPERPVQIIFAGKAHPADKSGKQALQKVFQTAQDPRFAGRIALVEDHDINVGRHLVQGVDVWLNNPSRPLEACGTSGQKAVLNGGLNCSILDGWWAEAYDGTNGFAIGRGLEHADPHQQTRLDLGALYDVLENEVVPLFYDQDETGVPRGWVARQKNAIRTLAWRFSARRMLKDYALGCYLPAAGGLTASMTATIAATQLGQAPIAATKEIYAGVR